ncbi:hypothetical protein [Flavobacterium silvaticum]|uniref:Uncharacterized protein n=1 Tax=Flavobacterium silvaticum TaxID=1852020 RepID=A0A972FUG2_9FLAO|nr:hypothetical protein [Flavobacterium silvaticum]NMH28718.1 hypothetical protein [Flavobacterium silvaticum]
MEPLQIRKLFRLSEYEMAQLLDITETEWSHAEAGTQQLPEMAAKLMAQILGYIDTRDDREKAMQRTRDVNLAVQRTLRELQAKNEYQLLLMDMRVESARQRVATRAKRHISAFAITGFGENKTTVRKLIESVSEMFSMDDSDLITIESQLILLQLKKRFFASELKKIDTVLRIKNENGSY